MQKAIKEEDWKYQWEYCKQFIEPALKHQDSYTIDDIEDKIRRGFFHLWPQRISFYNRNCYVSTAQSNEFIILWR